MKTTKSFFGLVMAMVPILFIGGLLLYLNHVRYAFGGFLDKQMMPTMVGLGAIGLIFVFLFVLKFRKAAVPPAPPADKVGDRVEAALAEGKSDFDPDAALARYMARRATTPVPPADRPPPGSFGRKGA
jgi:hypothetical protein